MSQERLQCFENTEPNFSILEDPYSNHAGPHQADNLSGPSQENVLFPQHQEVIYPDINDVLQRRIQNHNIFPQQINNVSYSVQSFADDCPQQQQEIHIPSHQLAEVQYPTCCGVQSSSSKEDPYRQQVAFVSTSMSYCQQVTILEDPYSNHAGPHQADNQSGPSQENVLFPQHQKVIYPDINDVSQRRIQNYNNILPRQINNVSYSVQSLGNDSPQQQQEIHIPSHQLAEVQYPTCCGVQSSSLKEDPYRQQVAFVSTSMSYCQQVTILEDPYSNHAGPHQADNQSGPSQENVLFSQHQKVIYPDINDVSPRRIQNHNILPRLINNASYSVQSFADDCPQQQQEIHIPSHQLAEVRAPTSKEDPRRIQNHNILPRLINNASYSVQSFADDCPQQQQEIHIPSHQLAEVRAPTSKEDPRRIQNHNILPRLINNASYSVQSFADDCPQQQQEIHIPSHQLAEVRAPTSKEDPRRIQNHNILPRLINNASYSVQSFADDCPQQQQEIHIPSHQLAEVQAPTSKEDPYRQQVSHHSYELFPKEENIFQSAWKSATNTVKEKLDSQAGSKKLDSEIGLDKNKLLTKNIEKMVDFVTMAASNGTLPLTQASSSAHLTNPNIHQANCFKEYYQSSPTQFGSSIDPEDFEDMRQIIEYCTNRALSPTCLTTEDDNPNKKAQLDSLVKNTPSGSKCLNNSDVSQAENPLHIPLNSNIYKTEICKKFLDGHSELGECAHKSNELQPVAQQIKYKSKVCMYFLRGCCRFSDNCWYSHSPNATSLSDLGSDGEISPHSSYCSSPPN